MEVALPPRFLGALRELPIVEARAEAAGNGLVLLGAFIVTEAIVCKAQGLWEHPALAVVLREERLDPLLPVAATGADLLFEVMEGDEGQDRVAQLGVLVLVNPPEALGV